MLIVIEVPPPIPPARAGIPNALVIAGATLAIAFTGKVNPSPIPWANPYIILPPISNITLEGLCRRKASAMVCFILSAMPKT